MHHVSKVHAMVLNLKRREDRWWFALGSLKRSNFPMM